MRTSRAKPEAVKIMPEWVGATTGAWILGVALADFFDLASQGHFTTKQLPGMGPRYLRSDVERLLAKSISPARGEEPAAATTR